MDLPSIDQERLQEEIEFWHSVEELRESMFSKCILVPGLSLVALNRMLHDDWCEWCKAHVGMPMAYAWTDPTAVEDPRQGQFSLD